MNKKKRARQASIRSKRRKAGRHGLETKDDFIIGCLEGKIRIIGDIVSPVESEAAWQYDLNNLDGKPRRQS